MSERFKKLFALSVALTLAFATLSTAVFAEEDEKPPELTITISPEEESESDAESETPPELTINVPDENGDSGNGDSDNDNSGDTNKIQIINADVFPKGFNPNITKTKISYEITQKAKIDVKIIDHTGQAVVNLMEGITVDKGKYFVDWNGTTTNQQGATLVPVGTYKYKIDAKNPNSGNLEDSESGDINVIYPAQQPDQPASTTQDNQTTATDTQAAATLAIQNSKSGQTAETGPGIFLYALLPLGGFLITRKRK